MYKMTLTKEQAEVLVKALDLFSRVGCGQFEEVLRHPTWYLKAVLSDKPVSMQDIRSHIDEAKYLLTGLKSGVAVGITVADEPNRVAYDILQVIQHRLAWDENPEGGMETSYHEPMMWSEQPAAKIEKEEENE